MYHEKHFSWKYTKCDGDTSSRSFSEKLKLSISLDQQSEVLHNLCLLYAKLRAFETLKLNCIPLSFISYQAFLKNIKTSGTSLPASFSE